MGLIWSGFPNLFNQELAALGCGPVCLASSRSRLRELQPAWLAEPEGQALIAHELTVLGRLFQGSATLIRTMRCGAMTGVSPSMTMRTVLQGGQGCQDNEWIQPIKIVGLKDGLVILWHDWTSHCMLRILREGVE